LVVALLPQPLRAEPLSPPSGSYEVTATLELPHLERWGVDKITVICLSNSRRPNEIPVPVVSANNPFVKCSATNLVADGSKLEYDIACPERGAARGHAVYELSTNAFTGPYRDGDGREKHDDDGKCSVPAESVNAARQS
jgi:hypothetical protein